MASVSTLPFPKLRHYAKSRLFNEKFHFGYKISFLKSRLYVKSRFVNRDFTVVANHLGRGEKFVISGFHFIREDLVQR